MCPIYENANKSRESLEKIRRGSKCAVCGGRLSIFWDTEKHLAFVACYDWPDTHHDGIAKAFEYRELNIESRREEMTQQHGETKTRALDKYIGRTALTRPQAQEIMEILWPKAPIKDKVAAAILCASYSLNPLANHIFLIPFYNKETKEPEWARIWGIKAKRLLASRKGGYSYLDMSPRIMTEDEQVKVWGEVDEVNICYLTHLKDMKTGAEVYGYGKWPTDKNPYGTDKGNTKANMAGIRSESQALDRLRPAEMPSGFAVADEQYIEGEGRIVDETTGEITEEQAENDKGEQKSQGEVGPLVGQIDEAERAAVTADRKRIETSVKKLGWDERKLKAYLAQRGKNKDITIPAQIPDDLVHKLANELADWESMA